MIRESLIDNSANTELFSNFQNLTPEHKVEQIGSIWCSINFFVIGAKGLTYQKSKPLKNPNLRSPQQWSPTKTYFSSGNSGGNQPGLTVPAIVGVVMIITSKWHGLCHEVFVVVSENDNEYTISDMEIIVLSRHWQPLALYSRFESDSLLCWPSLRFPVRLDENSTCSLAPRVFLVDPNYSSHNR